MGEQAMVARLRLAEIRMRDPFILEADPGKFVLFGATDGMCGAGPATGSDRYTSNELEQRDRSVPAMERGPGNPTKPAVPGRYLAYRGRRRALACL